MRVLQTHRFAKQVKKLTIRQKSELDNRIRGILADPKIGEPKRGDLAGVYVYKFNLIKQRYLLAYTLSADALTLLMMGPHENFYRNLKKP